MRAGTRRDAILYAVGANATHGLPRSNADKRRAVETMLRDEEWVVWSDREIARRTQTSAPFVAKVREETTVNIYSRPGARHGADGRFIPSLREKVPVTGTLHNPAQPTAKESGHGLWTRYLGARGIPERTARERIQKAEGRYFRVKHPAISVKPAESAGLHNPPALLTPDTANIGRRAEPDPAPAYEPVAAWETMPVGTLEAP